MSIHVVVERRQLNVGASELVLRFPKQRKISISATSRQHCDKDFLAYRAIFEQIDTSNGSIPADFIWSLANSYNKRKIKLKWQRTTSSSATTATVAI
jgi:hypothetical protein